MPFKTFANNDLLTAADVNNYLMRQAVAQVQSASERDAIPSPTSGLTIWRVDLGRLERHDGTRWRAMGAHARMKRSGVAKSINNSTWNQSLSANNLWTEDFRDEGIAAYADGWTIPWPGLWLVEFAAVFSGAVDIGVTVNKTTAPDFTHLSAWAQGSAGASAVGMPQGRHLLRLAQGDVIRLFGAGVPASISWRTEPQLSWFGIRYEGD